MKKNALLKSFISIFMLIALLGIVTAQAAQDSSQSGEFPSLTTVRIENNTIIIKGSKDFTYTLYKSNDPYRATVEIPDMRPGMFADKITASGSVISEVVPQQIDSPKLMTRLDIVLQSPSSLTPEYKDNTLVLSVRKDESVVLTEAKNLEVADASHLIKLAAVEAPAEKEAAPVTSKATEINSITVKKSADTVKVIISGNGTMIPNVFPVNERIVVDIPDTALRAAIPSQTISPLKGIRAGKHKEKLRIVLDLKEKTNFDVTAIGNTIEISLMSKGDAQPQQAVNPAPRKSAGTVETAAMEPAVVASNSAAPAPLTEGEYSGKKISLDFQDADIIPIFRLLGDISGYNVVVNPEVKGKITLKLINVPWDQALDVILRTFHLAKIIDGNIIRVLPTAAVAKELDDAAKSKKAAADAGDLKTRIFQINYADTKNLMSAIDKAKLLSTRGSISLDERGSSIIANDVEQNLEKIGALIRELDQEQMQARQVIIEARIVEVNSDYSKDLGISWGAFFRNPPTLGDNNFFVNQTGTGTQSSTTTSTSTVTSTPVDPLVNLPAKSIAGQIGLGYINRAATFALNLQLSAMETTGNGKIISSPRIMTMNNETAKIIQGRKLQLPSTDNDGKPKLQEVPINLELEVTPRITPSGAIQMKTKIKKDEFLNLITAGSNVGVDTTQHEVNTTVLINSGETLVIGGIFKQATTDGEDGIPGLSKLPVLGRLFKRTSKVDRSTELMVFLTPRVVDFTSMK